MRNLVTVTLGLILGYLLIGPPPVTNHQTSTQINNLVPYKSYVPYATLASAVQPVATPEPVIVPEVVPEPAPVVAAVPEPATPSNPTPSTDVSNTYSTGDCSLAYNYDWPKNVAYAVCMAESSGNHLNVGDTHTPWPSCGLMQIRTLPGRPSCEQLQDPVFNMDFAYNMWKGQGWFPWSAFKTGAYLRFLQ